jgi:uncharacterized protein YbbC (DUF1343 family)/CubicO group peptidase (beta-lactamase class C family)
MRKFFLGALLLFLSLGAQAEDNTPSIVPQFSALDRIVQEAVDQGKIPGAVVLVGHHGKVVYRKAFGWRSLEPTREPMTTDTIFDLASLTKCVATATSVAQLIEQGRIKLNDPVAAYLPEFAQNGKAQITVRELLTHYSGLAPDLSLKDPWKSRATAYSMVMESAPEIAPGTRFVYSDLNFITLGFIVEKLTGQSLDAYAAEHIYQPLGMKQTRFLPPAAWNARIAPTARDEHGAMLRGTVHDPTARRMGGVAGHAGVFSTADDLSLFAEELLHGNRILSRVAIEKMTTPQQPASASALRGLGWDIDSPFSSNRGELLPVGSYGHTGFTGTSLWIDPVTDSYIILLTNAVHLPHGSCISLRTRVASAVAAALDLTPSEQEKLRMARITGYNESLMAERRFLVRNGSVKTGIDVLEEHQFSDLHPNTAHPVRIGLIANQTAIDRAGQRTADVLAHTPGLKLTALFSPEHGFAGKLDTTEINNSVDAATGATIYSVYGDTDARRRPTAEALAQVDVLVYDIQDAGVRFYTFESTLGYFLEAAAKAGKTLVVLDRPNPLGGSDVQGLFADASREAFVNYGPVPVRHGMTVGELARFYNAEKQINAKLSVVAMEGWQRGDWFDATGLVWNNPSPNLRSLNEATLYPGIGLIEDSNLSVGRGTDTPFELVGAPWIDPTTLAMALNARAIEGVRFVPVRFTPTSSNYANLSCGGVNIILTVRDGVDAPELGLEIAATLLKLYPNDYKISKIDALLRNKSVLDALVAGKDPRRIAVESQESIDAFKKTRAPYLLY